jgi:hypothetical protein
LVTYDITYIDIIFIDQIELKVMSKYGIEYNNRLNGRSKGLSKPFVRKLISNIKGLNTELL